MTIGLQRSGILFAVSAPSGGGKSTVLKAIRDRYPDLGYSVSATSRAPRGSERDGVDYHFVSLAKFQEMIAQNAFFEWAVVHGNYYGTPREAVELMLAEGRDVLMDIDVQGARSLKEQCPGAVTIFLLPPSMATLEARLRGRHTDKEDVIQLRLKNAAREISECAAFDYVLVNDDLQRVVQDVSSILIAEGCRSYRQRLCLKHEPALETASD